MSQEIVMPFQLPFKRWSGRRTARIPQRCSLDRPGVARPVLAMGWHTRSPQAADAAVAADAFAQPLHETAGDPAFIGYFLMNEPTWGFAQETGGGHAVQHPNLLQPQSIGRLFATYISRRQRPRRRLEDGRLLSRSKKERGRRWVHRRRSLQPLKMTWPISVK